MTNSSTNKDLKNEIQNIKIVDNQIFKNDEILTRDFITFNNYWQKKHDDKDIQKNMNKLQGIDLKLFRSAKYLGEDNQHVTYWKSGRDLILVLDEQGWLLDAFIFNNRASKVIPTIHPNGDIYLLDYDETEARLYKIPRVW